MGQINKKLRSVQGCHFGFYCPGCQEMHHVGTSWEFDGNLEAPTISPSLLVRNGHFLGKDQCWCTFYAARPDEEPYFKCEQCHSFIKGGMIQFLGDCSHSLAGQTVPIPDLPPEFEDY